MPNRKVDRVHDICLSGIPCTSTFMSSKNLCIAYKCFWILCRSMLCHNISMSRSFMSRSCFIYLFFGWLLLRPSPSLAELRPILEPVTGISKPCKPWVAPMAGNSPTTWIFGAAIVTIYMEKNRFPCEDCGFLDQSSAHLSLVLHNFWSILHRNPVLTLEKITQDTVHGRNPKQSPGMVLKPCKEWDFNYLHLNWWSPDVWPINSRFQAA